MKIYRTLKGSPDIVIEFQKPNQVKNNENGKKQQNQMGIFKRKQQYFKFPATSNPQIDKFQKRILAFSNQYGPKHQKTTSIHMNYLQSVREAGVTCLKNKDLQKAAFFLAECLSFRDPVHDQIFYEKFLIVKIDAINKLMYCIFQMENWKNDFKENKSDRKGQEYHPLAKALKFLNLFLKEITQFPKYQNLKKSQHCLLEMNYFYLGRLNRKNHNNRQAIIEFQTALDLIRNKLTSKFYLKNEVMRNFMINVQIKIYYKLSKCYREQLNFSEQNNCEQKALQQARIHNQKLFVYISRKIKFYQRKRQFLQRLEKLDGRKRIQEEILKLIDESKQNEISSLYDAYLHQQFDQ